MKKNYFIFSLISILSLIIISGCTNKDSIATISVNSDSEHTNTFKKLNLGELYDFDFKLNNADITWVNVWIESYKDGKQEPQPLAELSYGKSPNKVEEGNLGFGIINTNDTRLGFLYAPNVTATPQKIDKIHSVGVFSRWDYAIGEDKVELKLGETYLLGAYRESNGNSIRTYNLQDENEVKKMISDDKIVFLLKIKIEEK
ncbi:MULTISPECIES: hypothetical protein [unclassified Peribacillus]|uniref:hypothetical protein n=1 Tax=unclassified Peribacillus TaxID=2675266 RepID=UPI0019121876|nr:MULTISPECIES: hypothetical protein [unclassified Peribacillus]MBK5445006.1 hypothetical protein [Peribacillus sp. TH24]MBK5460276.1 hypothetical protein [Peribacillus sp. TH27]MBK5482072.1 hypothetical protein [Peribacillus sp. TH16]MBK5498449.1 hypothetical protein [Peribacillus sp. TH14]WMX56436.1 hypothetical protein RE409_04150 [Peribacillus sp. R9-11]